MKTAWGVPVRRQTQEAPRGGWEMARETLWGKELEVGTGQQHLRVGRGTARKREVEEEWWAGVEGAGWQRLTQGGRAEGTRGVLGSRVEAAAGKKGRASGGQERKEKHQARTQQQRQANQSPDEGRRLAGDGGLYKGSGSRRWPEPPLRARRGRCTH